MGKHFEEQHKTIKYRYRYAPSSEEDPWRGFRMEKGKTLRTAEEQQILEHIKAVNEKREQLLYEASLLNSQGKIDASIRKKRGAEEARRYLNKLCAQHKRQYRSKKS